MNKVLLIANFHESSGWGECVRNFALAMDSVGIDIVCRSIKLDKANYPINTRLEELLKKSSKNCNICLQYLLPIFMRYDGNFDKCIGIYLAETDMYQHSDYVSHLNCMDEVWVPNNDMVDYALNSGVKVPIKIVPLAFNQEKYKKEYPAFEIPEAKGDFIFYFIGEAIRRKNLIAAIKAFHMEFSPNEPVQFLIKANKTGLSPEDCTKFLQELCFTAKSNLRLYRDISSYKSEIIITSSLSDEDVSRLHKLCDCHVMPSYGESWCTPPTTLINTFDNVKKIIDVSVGDLVYSHNGKLNSVLDVLCRDYSGTLINITTKYNNTAHKFTNKHPHLVVQRNGKRFKNVKLNRVFLNAEDIKVGDFLCVPKIDKNNYQQNNKINISDIIDVEVDGDGYIVSNHSIKINKPHTKLKELAKIFNCASQTISKAIRGTSNSQLSKNIVNYIKNNNIITSEQVRIKNEIELTPDFMFFLGHYIAEGWYDTSNGTLYAASHIDEGFARNILKRVSKDIFDLPCVENTLIGKKCVYTCIRNTVLGRFISTLCGNGARSKFIHNYLKNSEHINYLLNGMFYGDGHFSQQKQYKYSTSSRQLAFDYIQVCNMNNILIGMYYNKKRDDYNLICAKQYEDNFYNLINTIKYNDKCVNITRRNQNFSLEDAEYFYLPVTKIKKEEYFGKVYNLFVENENTYVTSNIATHNCIPNYEAITFGNRVIASNEGGPKDYVNHLDNGYLVKGKLQPCFGMEGLPNLYTAREQCFEVDINDLCRGMRWAYENRNKPNKADILKNYSYEMVGNRVKELLN